MGTLSRDSQHMLALSWYYPIKATFIYKLTSEEIYRKLFRTANDSLHVYSIYHRVMLTHSHTELHPRPLGGFQLTKRDMPNHRRPIVGMSLSEHVMTSMQR